MGADISQWARTTPTLPYTTDRAGTNQTPDRMQANSQCPPGGSGCGSGGGDIDSGGAFQLRRY